ncbi:MAG: class II SORL domain-containing protein [bacterium]
MGFEELLQKADWKSEKHVPVIEILEKGEKIKIKVSVGKEIAHPNKTEHHIAWIELYFKPEQSKFPYFIGKADFAAHGASVEGADTSTVYTEPDAAFVFKTGKSGTIYAFSYCNIHGLWVNEQKLDI